MINDEIIGKFEEVKRVGLVPCVWCHPGLVEGLQRWPDWIEAVIPAIKF